LSSLWNSGLYIPKSIPSLKARKLIRLLESAGCEFYREGKGEHKLYVRYIKGKNRVVPIDMGDREFSPLYVLRQFGFTDKEIDELLR
jgi:predicted RNA binding protein YcfA (HicA-like mRNA interferase family)